MSLPWFPYHIDKFLSDTLALDGIAVGAYHLLMLHYYATEAPPRDNDRVLATIARLPMDLWLERRPEIEVFFQIRGGAWHHATIEAEIADAKAKHAAGTARASAAGHARWANRPPKPAPRKAQAVPQASAELAASMKAAQSNAPALPDAVLKQSPGNEHLTITESLSVDVLTVEKDNSGDNSKPSWHPPSTHGSSSDTAGYTTIADQPDDDGVGAPIEPAFWPCENHISVCHIDGANDETIKREVAGFIATHQERGTFSHDWDASWTMWWKRWKDHRDARAAKEAAKAKPRVEVSVAPDWAAYAKRWSAGMGWPRGVGGEPGTASCRCPALILIESGIDPETGLKLTAAQIALRLEKLAEKV